MEDHYRSVEDAYIALEKENGGALAKATLKKVQNSSHSPEKSLKTFGVGSYRKVTDKTGKRWNPSLEVKARKCEGTPEQYYDRGNPWDRKFQGYEEVLVDGEIAGYVMHYEANDNKVFGFQSIEKMNDSHSINRVNMRHWSRLDAIGALISHKEEFVDNPLTLERLRETSNISGLFNSNKFQVEEVDENSFMVIEERKISENIYYRNAFLIEGGRAVSFIKMSDETYGPEGSKTRVLGRNDVETRFTERRKGYAKKLSKAIEKKYGAPLSSSGTFTELGFKAFGDNLHSSDPSTSREEWKPSVEAMNFVDDWDALIPGHKL